MRSLAAILVASTLSAMASAQFRLPSLPVQSPSLPVATQTLNSAESLASEPLGSLRLLRIETLYREHRDLIDRDPHGEPVVRNLVLALAPTPAALERAHALGFETEREQELSSLGLHLVVLKAPSGLSTRKALEKLRHEDPTGSYDYDHIYSPSGEIVPVAADAPRGTEPPEAVVNERIGLLDSGIDTHHPSLSGAVIHTSGCHERSVPAPHGTAIASLLVGRDTIFRGVAPGAALYAADVYCGEPTGGSVDALIDGLTWLIEQRVAVINVSLVGARNLMLERVVERLIAQGFAVVAAVGNDGPAAPPLYPASYHGVVGVTGVDAHRRVLIEAGRGPQVTFSAPGADLAAAATDGSYASVRGTSFAAPFIAGLLARDISLPDTTQVAAALEGLEQAAVHLGSPGRNLTYGFGLLGEGYRIDPTKLPISRH